MMAFVLPHLPVLPIVIPLVAGATVLLFSESRRRTRVSISLISAALQFAISVLLFWRTSGLVPAIWLDSIGVYANGIGVYAIGSWQAPFGIVLVVDHLSAFLLLLTATLALPVLLYSIARWDRIGVHFHALFQLLLVGLNGAFLTGDLFNLFVFVEVLLAASYGLLLHGSGIARVKSGLHYIVVNLSASLLFLIGVALIYGITGTLNMADLAMRVAALSPADRSIFQAGAGVLSIAFLIKAGCWPLNFWLPAAYAAAGAPVAAIFAIMTKVGVYAILRLGLLLDGSGVASPFGGVWLYYTGIMTMVFGIIGMLAAQQLRRLVAYSVIVSSGTILAALGLGSHSLIAPVLFYLLTSVLGTGAFFLLTGMTQRTRTHSATVPEFLKPAPALYTYEPFDAVGRSDSQAADDEVGIAIPAAMAFLGLTFVCCVLLVTGMPPLAGFVAKFALLSAAFGIATPVDLPATVWALIVTLLATGLAGVIALTRVGMRLFWSPARRRTPRLRVVEAAPVAFLLLLCVALSVAAGPVMTYLDSAVQALLIPQLYIDAVTGSVADMETAGLAP